MAARLNTRQADTVPSRLMGIKDWPFYVYEFAKNGVILYIGKGSRYRLRAQCKRFGIEGYELARFKREADAYKYEIRKIAESKPLLNKHPGGNGPRSRKRRTIKPIGWTPETLAASKVLCARLVLAAYRHRDMPSLKGHDWSNIDKIRQVAYGIGA